MKTNIHSTCLHCGKTVAVNSEYECLDIDGIYDYLHAWIHDKVNDHKCMDIDDIYDYLSAWVHDHIRGTKDFAMISRSTSSLSFKTNHFLVNGGHVLDVRVERRPNGDYSVVVNNVGGFRADCGCKALDIISDFMSIGK